MFILNIIISMICNTMPTGNFMQNCAFSFIQGNQEVSRGVERMLATDYKRMPKKVIMKALTPYIYFEQIKSKKSKVFG